MFVIWRINHLSDNEESLGEDASKQGRIDDVDAEAVVAAHITPEAEVVAEQAVMNWGLPVPAIFQWFFACCFSFSADYLSGCCSSRSFKAAS
ncbi:hypothetical protein Tco_0553797 [Tanacetum coccineum]